MFCGGREAPRARIDLLSEEVYLFAVKGRENLFENADTRRKARGVQAMVLSWPTSRGGNELSEVSFCDGESGVSGN